jgi:hypothetical protein
VVDSEKPDDELYRLWTGYEGRLRDRAPIFREQITVIWDCVKLLYTNYVVEGFSPHNQNEIVNEKDSEYIALEKEQMRANVEILKQLNDIHKSIKVIEYKESENEQGLKYLECNGTIGESA